MLLQDAELRIVHRDGPGQPDPRLIGPGEIELARRRLDRLAGGAARFDRGEIEHRLDLNEAAQVARLGRLALGQQPPREMRRASGQHIVDRVGRHVHRPGQRVGRNKAVRRAQQAEIQPGQRAAQARVGAQCPDQRRRLAHPAGDLLDLRLRQIEQRVAREERAALQRVDRAEMLVVGLERRRQLRRRLIDQLRGRRVHDDQNALFGKAVDIVPGALDPRQVARKQLLDVGREPEMRCRVDSAQTRQHERGRDDEAAMARTELDEARNWRSRHVGLPLRGGEPPAVFSTIRASVKPRSKPIGSRCNMKQAGRIRIHGERNR